MSSVNVKRVQSTNDQSTVSKCSTVNSNYYEDNFIDEFVEVKKRRAPLIHLGYYTRAIILNKLIFDYVKFFRKKKTKFQIVSCGAGFDTTYWRLMEQHLLDENSVFVEVDFFNVIQKKISLIQKSEKLKFYTNEVGEKKFDGFSQMNNNFFLVEADLSDLNQIEKHFSNIGIDYDVPTLFISECVITYMKTDESDKLIQWMANKFTQSGFINYEQIHPDDGFGSLMLSHFEKLNSHLFSVKKYPDCKSHKNRYAILGFESSHAVSEWDAFCSLTSEKERLTALKLELFDEFEEFHLKCLHYVVGLAGNGTLQEWLSTIPFFKDVDCAEEKVLVRKEIPLYHLNIDKKIHKHLSCTIGDDIYIFGGTLFSVINRLNTSHRDYAHVECVPEDNAEKLRLFYGSVTTLKLKNSNFVCVYGGRGAPDKTSNNGSAIVYELIDETFVKKLITTEGNPPARYRCSSVSMAVSDTEFEIWIFGGRTPYLEDGMLADIWKLTINIDSEGNLTYLWTSYQERGPRGRMSHSAAICRKKRAMYVFGGLIPEKSKFLNDLWVWDCELKFWNFIKLPFDLSPRYGHTSHIVGDFLYLVGGVGMCPGMHSAVAKIDLSNYGVIEYEIKENLLKPFLFFNHTSEIITDKEEKYVWVIGGGGNLFSFGTYLNEGIHFFPICESNW